MVREVTYDSASWNELPWKFEAGTPPIAEGIGLGAAVDFLSKIGMKKVQAHEQKLTKRLYTALSKMKNVEVYGPAPAKRVGLVAFNLKGVHPHDVASILDHDGIAVRAGHHCAMPLTYALGLSASVRASLGIYSTEKDIDALIQSLQKTQQVFSR